jgi:hypothetical protein
MSFKKRWLLDTKKGFIIVDEPAFVSGENGRYIGMDGEFSPLFLKNPKHKKLIMKVMSEDILLNYAKNIFIKRKRKKIRFKIKRRL